MAGYHFIPETDGEILQLHEKTGTLLPADTNKWKFGFHSDGAYIRDDTAAEVKLLSTATGAPISSAFVTIGNDATLTGERALTGTANQITITDNGANSTVVLSTPQNIHTGASPTFAGLTLTGALTVGTTLDVAGHSAFGAGASPLTNYVIYLEETASTNADLTGFSALVIGQLGTASTSRMVTAIEGAASTGASSGTVTRVSGGRFFATGDASAGVTLSLLHGVYAEITNTGGAATPVVAAIFDGAAPLGVAATTFYGLRLPTITGLGATAYGIYQPGTGRNVFEAQTRFGGLTAPTQAVSVTGNANLSGVLAVQGATLDTQTWIAAHPVITGGSGTYNGINLGYDVTGAAATNNIVVRGLHAQNCVLRPATGTTGHLLAGLNFVTGLAGGGGACTVTSQTSVFARNFISSFTGTVTDAFVLDIGSLLVVGGTPVVTTSYGIRIANQGHSSTTDVYGIRILDQTAGTNRYAISQDGADDRVRMSGMMEHPLVGLSIAASPTNDVSITSGTFFRVTTTTGANFTLTGFTSGVTGRWIKLVNASGFNMLVTNEDAGSTAANRVITGTGATVTITTDGCIEMVYDATSSRWRICSTQP